MLLSHDIKRIKTMIIEQIANDLHVEKKVQLLEYFSLLYEEMIKSTHKSEKVPIALRKQVEIITKMSANMHSCNTLMPNQRLLPTNGFNPLSQKQIRNE